ncbi:MAG: pyridoxamine 5'-phosphate oxidase [Flammeovirgaceae bacterium]
MELSEIRKEYTLRNLDGKAVLPSPIKQFELWMEEAIQAKVNEPNAMTLSTVTTDGRPSARIVLLKGIEDDQFVFYTNLQSQKGKELEGNPACALTFFWPELERQVRIEGTAIQVKEDVAVAYFQSRPRSSQVGAWTSPQSSIIKDRQLLDERDAEIEKRFRSEQILPKPKQWGGYQVQANEIEFWQGRPSRLHDRIAYYLVDGKWTKHRLAP